MNFAKFKSKKIRSPTSSVVTTLSTNQQTVKADNAEMADLPKGINAQSSKYSFIPTVKSRLYRGVEHDSLVITSRTNSFSWNSRNISGRGGFCKILWPGRPR